VYLIDDYAFDTEALLISGNGANVGYIHYYNGKFNAYQRTYVLHGFIQNIFLVKYFLDQFLSVRIEREKKAGNTPYIVLDTLSKMKLNIPTDISEQKAIADILSAADEEIDVLNKKLEAFKNQKQGLMQQLLTGKIRVKVN
jgi:type I restriction enzyme S subunit